MFKVYRKLFAYVPEKRYLIYVSVVLSVLSTQSSAALDYIRTADWRECSLFYRRARLHVLGVLRLETNLRKRGIDGLAGASFRFFDLNSSGRIRKIIDDNASQTHSIVAHLLPDIANALAKPFLLLIVGFIVSLRVGICLTILTVGRAVLLYAGMSGETQFMKY